MRHSAAISTTAPAEPVLGDFVDAARQADSAESAVQLALNMLCEKLEASSGILFQRAASGLFQPAAIYPAHHSAFSLAENGFLLSRFRFYLSALPISPGDLDSWSRWAAEQRPGYLAEIEQLKGFEARLATPLKSRNEIVGLLLLGPSSASSLRNWPALLALMLENARLT